jgi:uncharacterized C2H2 Zn-finger protein
MLEKKLHCPKCDRRFAREGHLARHLNAIHGGVGAKRGPKPKSMKRRGRVGRPPGSGKRPGRRVGRPPGGKLGLGRMSLEQLSDLIASAKQHAQDRLHSLMAAFE